MNRLHRSWAPSRFAPRVAAALVAGAAACSTLGCAAQAEMGFAGQVEVEARPDPVHAIGALPPGSCDVGELVARVGPCERLGSVRARATGDAEGAEAVFDGDACRGWSSTAPAPQSIALDLGAARTVSAVLLVPEMTTNGTVTHVVEASEDGVTYHPIIIWNAEMRSGQGYAVTLPEPIVATHLRVGTAQSPSAVGWWEIAPLSCD